MKELVLADLSSLDRFGRMVKSFSEGASRNTSIEILTAGGIYLFQIGRPGLAALLGLPKTLSKMKQLHLDHCGLNDDNIPALASILKETKLECLSLVGNMAITSQGWSIFSEALVGHTSLEILGLRSNSIGDDGAIKFAGALKENTTLKTLYLVGNGAITEVGWSAFADLLCSTSSIEKTLHSNHTLESLGFMIRGLPKRSLDLLEMNRNPNKKQVAINKILKYHEDLAITPLLEFGLGMLPAVVEWFDGARSCPRNFEANIDKKKLSAVYEFINGNPEAPKQHWSAMP